MSSGAAAGINDIGKNALLMMVIRDPLKGGAEVEAAMRIVCIHQGYELYGSDRCFVESIAALRDGWPLADIEVVLPRDGPIVAPLKGVATRIVFEPLLILRRRAFAKLLASLLLRLFPALWRAARRMWAADIVLVNTVVVLDYLLLARFFSRKTVVHVHEIPDGAKLHVFRWLLRWTNAEIIFNSRATRAAYALSPDRAHHTVYNGIAAPARLPRENYDGSRPLRLLMLGRINRIKGQDLLIEALAKLPCDILRRLEVRIVGGSFENDVAREQSLRAAALAAGLDPTIRFEPFTSDTEPLYLWADVVAVPSRLPESFGRVAIEAMAHGLPVIAAQIGGLVEIVENVVTGWLFPPNNAHALARAIASMVTAPEEWRGYGAASRARYEAHFSAQAVRRQLQSIIAAKLAYVGERSLHDVARV